MGFEGLGVKVLGLRVVERLVTMAMRGYIGVYGGV